MTTAFVLSGGASLGAEWRHRCARSRVRRQTSASLRNSSTAPERRRSTGCTLATRTPGKRSCSDCIVTPPHDGNDATTGAATFLGEGE
jgi:hypothetical protein